jgi:2-polyprenyl-3-methyl-5-hydroxy-6-metoxy-1,4-benzoquinol methylase
VRYSDKRIETLALDAVQAGNRHWWTERTMSYDWTERVDAERFSRPWFDEIDRRFIHAGRLFAHGKRPFDRIIPFEWLNGRPVLEIGCGMGLQTELMARAGAHVTAVDISDTSVAATRARAALKGFACDVRQADAGDLQLPDASFDFVWSWGVIHHSAYTGRIVKEMHRVLAPGGQARAMVYNLGGMPAYVQLLKYMLQFWRGASLDRMLWQSTDGFSARFYTRDMVADLFNTFFANTQVEVLGQDADAVPLPRPLRKLILPMFSPAALERMVRRRGGFLFVTADK